MENMQLNALVWFVVLSAAGWVALVKGLRRRRALTDREERERGRATGTIVEIAQSKKGPARPVVEFTAEGAVHRRACADAGLAALPVGTSVEVRYDPDAPERFHLEREKAPKSGGGLIFAGICWIAICALLATGASTLRGHVGMDLRRAVRVLHITDFTELFRRSEGDDDQKDGDYRYTPDGQYFAVVKDYTGSEERVSVPMVLGGRVVSGLAPGAYSRCDTLVHLTVPAIIHDIPAACFAGCIRLREVELSEGVQSIQTHAFDMCPSLNRVTLPASLERIADDAFPGDCKAGFEVIEGSAAERYCREKGFEMSVSPAE